MVEEYSGDPDIFGDENIKVLEVCVSKTGTVDVNVRSIEDADDVHIDLSSIKTKSTMDNFLTQFDNIQQHSSSSSTADSICNIMRKKTTSFYFMAKNGEFDCRPEYISMNKIAAASSGPLVTTILNKQLFSKLSTLNFNYVNFTSLDFQIFCDFLNPLKGRAFITKLTLYRCELDDERIQKLFKDIHGNILLTYIDLTSNRIGNIGIQAIADCLSYHEVQIKYLALGNNNFSDEGLYQLNRIFCQHQSHLQYLHLPNNHQLTDLPLDQTFANIVTIGQLKQLTLSGCKIQHGQWSRYLPFLRSLQILNLSYNHISDRAIYQILFSLQDCFSIQEIDLSYNHFRLYHMNYIIKSLLIHNQSIQALALNGNRFLSHSLTIGKGGASSVGGGKGGGVGVNHGKGGNGNKDKVNSDPSAPSIWHLISEGLKVNKTLLTLSLQDCGIQLQNLFELLPALRENNIVQLRLENNPLPMDAIQNVRRYYQQEWQLLSLSKHRELESLRLICQWRKEQRQFIEKELESLAIVVDKSDLIKDNANNEGEVLQEKLLEDRQNLELQGREPYDEEVKEELDDVSPLFSSIARMRMDETHPSLDTTIVSAKAITNILSFQRLIWSPEVIQRSTRYRSTEELDRLVDDIEQMNSTEGKLIDIAFGREAFILGSVQIFAHTTYETLREIVKPLVKEHAATVDGDRSEEFLNFKISDPRGKILETEQEMKSRRVWSELFNQERQLVVLRPATWMSL